MGIITVYNMRFCPFAQRTILVLLEKKVPFNVVNINRSKKPEWFLADTWGTVSVVRHKGAHIMESLVNSDYIDEVKIYPNLYEEMKKEGTLVSNQLKTPASQNLKPASHSYYSF